MNDRPAQAKERTVAAQGVRSATVKGMSHMYDLTMNSIAGEPVALEQYRGQVSLIVNVASA